MLNEDKFSCLYTMCQNKLESLDAAFQRAMSMPISEERAWFLLFLDRERNVYSFSFALLKEIREASSLH